jgi:hypothetical protein
MNGQYIEDYEYNIEGTPCEVVVEERRLVHYPNRIIELFPNDPDLTALRSRICCCVGRWAAAGLRMGNTCTEGQIDGAAVAFEHGL